MSTPEQRGDKHDEGPRLPLGWARQYFLVLEFLAYLAVFGYIGARLDARFGWQPWGIFGGLMLATALGVYRMIREAQKLDR